MDWVGYLTTRLVDDIASHLRLFREARSALARTGKAGREELINQFFEREAEKEKDICRDEVCLKVDAEKGEEGRRRGERRWKGKESNGEE